MEIGNAMFLSIEQRKYDGGKGNNRTIRISNAMFLSIEMEIGAVPSWSLEYIHQTSSFGCDDQGENNRGIRWE